MSEVTHPVVATRPERERHLFAGVVQGGGWDGKGGKEQKAPEHPKDPNLLKGSSAITKTGPDWEDSAAESVKTCSLLL